MRAHVIWSHPRATSLTAHSVDFVTRLLVDQKFEVDSLDLYRADFDPVLDETDEPDWDDSLKKYSAAVETLVNRAQLADLVVVVFPVWWFGLPAILKGYFDRVWNYGRLYGDGAKANARAILWVGLAGLPEASFVKRGYDEAIQLLLNEGIAGYCDIPVSQVELIYDTIENVDIGLLEESLRGGLSKILKEI